MHHAKSKVSIVEVKIVWNGPHDNEMNVLFAQLPGDDSAGSRDGVLLVNGHHKFAMGGEHLAFVVTELETTVAEKKQYYQILVAILLKIYILQAIWYTNIVQH